MAVSKLENLYQSHMSIMFPVTREVRRDFLFIRGTHNNMEIDTSLYVLGNCSGQPSSVFNTHISTLVSGG